MKYRGGNMTSTVLNDIQRTFLEDIITQFGNVVSYEQIEPNIPYQDDSAKRRFVSQLSRAGWLVRIKKGLYQVAADIGSLGTLTISRYAIAQHLLPGSYVSFEAALQFHGLHDQLLQTTTSIGLQQRATVTLEGYIYRFVKTTEQYFFGFGEHRFDDQTGRIATVEKALIDMVQFHRSTYSADRVLEILSESRDDVDQKRLTAYLLKSNLTTQRVFGLLFDYLNISYDKRLEESARSSQAASRSEPHGQEYNAKWRLYYDPGMFRHYSSHQSL
jgi:predicted transcriptional regulator of viral defense system